jgi:hypothetical protein
MNEWERLLRWHCGDLRDERLRQASGLWIVLTALGRDPSLEPAPDGLAVSTAMAPADLASAGPVVFPLPEGPAAVQVFGLWRPQTALEEPLQRQHWLFWVVPGRQIHAERRSMGLNPLTRAHGPGGPAEHLAAQLLPLLGPP